MDRFRVWAVALGTVFLQVGCQPAPGAETVHQNIRAEIKHGKVRADHWIRSARSGVPDDSILWAVGYLEQLRLGLGSPFRLVEMSQHDPRFSPTLRSQVGWALLAQIQHGQSFQFEPKVLDLIALANDPLRFAAGEMHTELLERTVAHAAQSHLAERTLRVAYALSSAEGTLDARALRIVARAAGMARDRALAEADLRALLKAANRKNRDVFALLAETRSARGFQVERPLAWDERKRIDTQAGEPALNLLPTIRAVAQRTFGVELRTGTGGTHAPFLGPDAAQRLLLLSDSFPLPPRPALVVSAGLYREKIEQERLLSPVERDARRTLAEAADTEERFAAAYAVVHHAGKGYGYLPAMVHLWVSTALRSDAQEPVWFPGHGGPTEQDLRARHGFESVRFDPSVPEAWRPYYRMQLDRGLADLREIMPGVQFSGMKVKIGNLEREHAVLAVHNPRRREVTLPIRTGGGTMAHEFAHDLDWQIARKRYGVRGDYGMDRAMRVNDASIRLLLPALQKKTPEPLTPHDRRPAETFARNVDWLVAVGLADRGRYNGYLSSFQDDVVTGYGTIAPSDLSGEAAVSLVRLLEGIALIQPEVRIRFLSRYGPGEERDLMRLVRWILEAPVPDLPVRRDSLVSAGSPFLDPHVGAVHRQLQAIVVARDEALQRMGQGPCGLRMPVRPSYEDHVRRRVVLAAVRARSVGIATEFARAYAGEAGGQWMKQRLLGGEGASEPLDDAILVHLEDVRATVERIAEPNFRGAEAPSQWPEGSTERPCLGTSLREAIGPWASPRPILNRPKNVFGGLP